MSENDGVIFVSFLTKVSDTTFRASEEDVWIETQDIVKPTPSINNRVI